MKMSFRYRLKLLQLAVSRPFRKTHTAKVCGHPTKQEGVCVSFKEERIVRMPLSKDGTLDYCLDCIGGMSIKCAWCGKSIHIGNPITLYPATRYITALIPKHAVRWEENPEYLVGCLRFVCADSGIDRAGFWIPPGKVMRVPSPIDLLFSPEKHGRAVIVGDLNDPNDHGRLVG